MLIQTVATSHARGAGRYLIIAVRAEIGDIISVSPILDFRSDLIAIFIYVLDQFDPLLANGALIRVSLHPAVNAIEAKPMLTAVKPCGHFHDIRADGALVLSNRHRDRHTVALFLFFCLFDDYGHRRRVQTQVGLTSIDDSHLDL